MVPWRQRWGYIYDIVLQDKLEQTVLILVHYTKKLFETTLSVCQDIIATEGALREEKTLYS